MNKLFFTLIVGIVGSAAVFWIIDLQRRLQAARIRGDMYRDISIRLDRRLSHQETT